MDLVIELKESTNPVIKTNQTFTVKNGIYKKAIRSVSLPEWVKRVVVDDSKQGLVDITHIPSDRDVLYIHNNSYVFKKPETDNVVVNLKIADRKYEVNIFPVTFGNSGTTPDSFKKAVRAQDVKDSNNKVFAEVIGNHIFFHIDWLSPFPFMGKERKELNPREALDILKTFLSETVKYINNDIDFSEIKNNVQKYVFMDIAKKQIKHEIKAKEEAVKKDSEMLEKLREELANLSRRLNINIKFLQTSRMLSREVEERAEKVYNKMKNMKGIKSLKVSADGEITIIAGPIILTKGSRKYNLGDYRITIKDANVNVRNLKAEKLKCQEDHPHIRQDGSRTQICWGNWAPVTEHIARYEYDVALAYILMLLRSWNPDDTFIDLEPLAEKLKIKPE